MKIRDLSIRKRLLLSNFIMIFIPVVFMVTVSIGIFLFLRFGNINRASMISFLWPESGPTLSTQFELSRLRVRADSFTGEHLSLMLQSSHHLEDLGFDVVIYQGEKELYHTKNASGEAIWQQAQEGSPVGDAAVVWSDAGLVFRYDSPFNDIRVAVVGAVPLRSYNGFIDLSSKNVLKTAFFILVCIAVILTIFIGLYLSRWLALQIIQPLENLRNTADDISKGNLDRAVRIENNDEIGQTCRSFESMRQQLKTAQEMRKKYDHNRKELIAGISHDLSTPLTKIEGYACGIRDGIANTPEKQQHYLTMIINTSRNMGHLVRTLFLFSKLDLKQIPFHWETVDICAYMEDFAAEQQEQLARRGLLVTCEINIKQALISIDRTQFQRVVENIIENSIKYKDQAQGNLRITVQTGQPHYIQLLFADDGQGIADEASLPKLFDSFYRTDKARSNVANGSGLGLAVVKQIITTMGGTIWAAQTRPKGLTIGIELPEGDRYETSTHH